MGKINSKAKGRRFELSISKLFNEKFGKDMFKPTPGSGAITGGKNKELTENLDYESRLTLSADIISPMNFRFLIECKNYAEIQFWDLFNESSKLNNWTEQSLFDSNAVNKKPMIIMKFNRKPTLVMTNIVFGNYTFSWFDKNKNIWYTSLMTETLNISNEQWFL